MIYTVTLNPSLDYIITTNGLELGMTNRTTDEMILPGGKGINVSTILTNLEIENTALGFKSGFTGKQIELMLKEMNINSRFIEVKNGLSRINIKIKNIDGTEINGNGPDIQKEDINKLIEIIKCVKDGDVLVLAGSIPSCMTSDIYKDILECIEDKDVMVIVDATNELLLKVLKYKPFLIKPNIHELGEIFNVKIKSIDEVFKYAGELKKLGARNVLVSMGKEGAVLISDENKKYVSKAPKGKLVNSVGAGDSMVAGFIAGYLKKENYVDAFKYGVAAGSASAFSAYLAKKDEINEVLNLVEVVEIERK